MKKDIILILSFLFIGILYSQVQFNFEFSLYDINPEDRVQNIWLDDFDENGEEEIWVVYYHEVSYENVDYFRLISYNLQGETLSAFTKACNQDSTYKGCTLAKSEENEYRIEVYEYIDSNNPTNPVSYCIIQLYDHATNDLIDTLDILINEPLTTNMLTDFDFNFMRQINYEDINYIYLGLQQGYPGFTWCYVSRLYKFQLGQDSINLIEEMAAGGESLIKHEANDFLISLYNKDWNTHPGPGGGFQYSAHYLSLSSPTTGFTFQSGFCTSGQLTCISKNDLSHSTFGQLVTLCTGNYIQFKNHTPDFSGIQWEENVNMSYSVSIISSTCLSIDQIDDHVLYFYKYNSANLQYFYEIRNRTNGELIISQETTFAPKIIDRKQDGELLFYHYGNATTQIDVYSIEIDFNYPPFLIFPINDIEVNEDFTETIELNLDFYFDDPNGDVLNYSVDVNDEIALVEIDENILSISALENLNGSTLVTITANDNYNRNSRDTCETSFNLTINAVNDPPEIISFFPEELSFVITEEQEINFEVVAEDIDSVVEYAWYVNEENMNNPDSIFIYNFTENGEFEVKCIITDEEFILDTIWNVTVNLTGIIDDSILSLSTQLIGSYPNPFNPTTIIEFSIQNKSKVELAIFNITGQKVKQLVSDQLSAGQHSVVWNGDDESGKSVSSGIYYYKLNVNGKTEAVKKCLLLK